LRPSWNLALEISGPQEPGQEHRLLGPPDLDHRLVGRVRGVGLHEPAQDGLGGGGADPDRGRILDHLVVLFGDPVPPDGAGHRRFQVRPQVGFAGGGAVELRLVDPFDAGQQVEPQQLRDAEPDLGLAV
jgi:hypothetical protein